MEREAEGGLHPKKYRVSFAIYILFSGNQFAHSPPKLLWILAYKTNQTFSCLTIPSVSMPNLKNQKASIWLVQYLIELLGFLTCSKVARNQKLRITNFWLLKRTTVWRTCWMNHNVSLSGWFSYFSQNKKLNRNDLIELTHMLIAIKKARILSNLAYYRMWITLFTKLLLDAKHIF